MTVLSRFGQYVLADYYALTFQTKKFDKAFAVAKADLLGARIDKAIKRHSAMATKEILPSHTGISLHTILGSTHVSPECWDLFQIAAKPIQARALKAGLEIQTELEPGVCVGGDGSLPYIRVTATPIANKSPYTSRQNAATPA